MVRNSEYQEFLDVYHGRKNDELPKDQEIPAETREIGWVKQQQVRRAIGKARRGRATPEDLDYIAKHAGIIFPNTSKKSRLLIKRRSKIQT